MMFKNRIAVLATMHRKEDAIAPILESDLGLKIQVPTDFDTDRFGTFTREIARSGDQLEAARKKALAALEIVGGDLAIASEGSFAPHPSFPMLPCDREIVLLIDTLNDLEIIGESISTETNFNHRTVSNYDQAYQFAMKVGFPDHKLVVIKQHEIVKGIGDFDQLKEAVSSGKVRVETDMRAMNNPTRMKVIAQATRDLVEKLRSCCPNCSTPGFTVADVRRGLPCGWCGSPTNLILASIDRCSKCGFEQEQVSDQKADPMYCPYCNP
ncbi:hypothetical protein IQ250_10500 [Pseudanabaenaceae cyanobacterium LEGE 13415]|nr:hypothetical protein [Pseudanabaenaceae cyanobacterium LEGE 13415]